MITFPTPHTAPLSPSREVHQEPCNVKGQGPQETTTKPRHIYASSGHNFDPMTYPPAELTGRSTPPNNNPTHRHRGHRTPQRRTSPHIFSNSLRHTPPELTQPRLTHPERRPSAPTAEPKTPSTLSTPSSETTTTTHIRPTSNGRPTHSAHALTPPRMAIRDAGPGLRQSS